MEENLEPPVADYITSGRRRRSTSRRERAAENRRALLRAAATAVARYGYNGASVSRITELAGVAQGTFYNYFPTRCSLFEHLLPETGQQMLEYIGERVHGSRSYRELEARGIRAFFSFLAENSSFLRVLDDAEIAVPMAYRKHMRNLERHYLKALLRGRDANQLNVRDPRKLRVFIYSLMGARRFLAFRYVNHGARSRKALPAAVAVYDQFLQFGLRGRATAKGEVKRMSRPKAGGAVVRHGDVKSAATREALLKAAAHIVGTVGYEKTTIAMIVRRAGVATGTFYGYFDSQQQLFDQLLDYVTRGMTQHLVERTLDAEDPLDFERRGFPAFFEYLYDHPEYLRIEAEAKVWAPSTYKRHIQSIARSYMAILQRLWRRANWPKASWKNFEPLVYILIGTRRYIAYRFMGATGKAVRLPLWISEAYFELVAQGLSRN